MATLNIKGLDDRLYQRLKDRAVRQHRSVAQEVTHILTEVLASSEQTSLMALEGLGKHLWKDRGAADHVANERDSWD